MGHQNRKQVRRQIDLHPITKQLDGKVPWPFPSHPITKQLDGKVPWPFPSQPTTKQLDGKVTEHNSRTGVPPNALLCTNAHTCMHAHASAHAWTDGPTHAYSHACTHDTSCTHAITDMRGMRRSCTHACWLLGLFVRLCSCACVHVCVSCVRACARACIAPRLPCTFFLLPINGIPDGTHPPSAHQLCSPMHTYVASMPQVQHFTADQMLSHILDLESQVPPPEPHPDKWPVTTVTIRYRSYDRLSLVTEVTTATISCERSGYSCGCRLGALAWGV